MGSVGSKVKESQNPYTTKLDDMDIDEIRDYVFEKLGVEDYQDVHLDSLMERSKLRREREELSAKWDEIRKLIDKEEIPFKPTEDEIQTTINDMKDFGLDITREEAIRELREMNRMFPNYTERGKELLKEGSALFDEIKKRDSRITELNDEIEEQSKKISRDEIKRQNWAVDSLPKKAGNIDFSKVKGFSNDTATSGIESALEEGRGYVSMMSPKEYLQRITYDIFNKKNGSSYMRKTLVVNWANVKKYAKQMREGVKFDMPWLNYSYTRGNDIHDWGQEGRHRALAALLNGYSEIPVAIVTKKR